jgi:phosphatidylglycerol:prolipoprotein diacylglycerol transferase
MNGIVINLDPIILRIGDFEMRWYSAIIIVAVAVAAIIWEHQSRKKGISSGEIYRLGPWAVVAGIVGARLFHVIDHWNFYVANPLQIIQLQQGGLAIWGVITGVTVTTIIYARLRHLPLGRLMDAAVPAILVALIISRLACTINGDAPGSITAVISSVMAYSSLVVCLYTQWGVLSLPSCDRRILPFGAYSKPR